jgi:hypothetical protein
MAGLCDKPQFYLAAALTRRSRKLAQRPVPPIGRLIDSRQYRSKSVEIGDPIEMIAGSLPDLMFAAGIMIIDGLGRK